MCTDAEDGPPSLTFPRNGFLRYLLSQSRPLARNRFINFSFCFVLRRPELSEHCEREVFFVS